ncbi:hypothetical protein E3Q18_01718 [Wallemia mellicola]|nr:hypothetical protein E3Q18_01718 [Wallemia mellicola]
MMSMLNYNFFYKPINQQSNSISNETWSNKLNQLSLSKTHLNKLVLDYLVIEGYTDPANNFAKETGLDMTKSDIDSINERRDVKDYITIGDIHNAISTINEINPDILDQNTELYFNLQLQQLIEYIRHKEINQALEFAQTTLSQIAITIPSLLPSLESALTLLAFNSPDNEQYAQAKDAPGNIRQLLSQSQRERVANQVNTVILEDQMHSKEPKLAGICKLLSWGEDALSSRVSFPRYQPPLHKHGKSNQQNDRDMDANKYGQFDQQMLT